MEGDGHEGWGEAVAEAHPYYSGETTETVWHIVTEFLAPLVVGRDVRAPARRVPGDEARARPQHGQGAARDDRLGPLRADHRPARCRRCWAAPAIASPRACRSASRTRSTSSSRRSPRSGRRLPAHQDQDQARAGTSTPSSASAAQFGDIPLMVDANAAYRLDDSAHLARLDPVQPDDDRAAARLRRRDGPRGAAAGASPRRSAWTSRFTPCASPATPSPRRPAGSSTSSPAASAATSSRSSCTTCAPPTTSRCGTAACSKAASAAPTTSTSPACRTSRLPGDIAASKRYYVPDLIEPGIDIAADGTIAVPTGPRHRRHRPCATASSRPPSATWSSTPARSRDDGARRPCPDRRADRVRLRAEGGADGDGRAAPAHRHPEAHLDPAARGRAASPAAARRRTCW